ncbi:hypothetical protein MYCTH_2300067 [Thermothelomyces thermophilus ATCC 42464]|uniref:STAS domain-containing protein n=1 Tax=Thermothelomyces thermophilus (strain ATCC 42464 / BCRC 31852 / DSM 1799) TaxID=573729 RepID=G2QA86_THET4|nr:uncharacterized protein MYCTH_2300067 [Thermothelomyces thermophilus ATCC 42464]AEO55834.1 hypothetical protein MYCTH_2300067 [Thermothelomyces thermophilus ATCC 42464]
MMQALEKAKKSIATDYTWQRARQLTVSGARALPGAAAEYVTDKFPIIGWLPRYRPRWLVNDVIAGLTIGLMLIPQGLSYARIATVPVQYGLLSCWFPPMLYALMGTTKDLSTGPTSLISLLTAETIESLQGGGWSAQEIASAVAMMMGIYGLVIGLLKLGFLLDFISLPVLSGFISAVAITIILNQMDSLLGEPDVRDGTANQIHDVFQQLPRANGYACAVGFTGILLLAALDRAGRRWGKRNKVVWFLSITRAFITLVIFTGVGYAVNKSRGSPDRFLFDVTQVSSAGGRGIQHPRVPDAGLLSRVAARSVAVFVGSAVEHTAIARSFGVRNGYIVDQSQELTYYGATNVVNSFFHAHGVGGAMSRTAVNSACNVRSPLSGFVAAAVVLVSIYELLGTLYWVPKATLAAIIITACWPLISPPSVFYRYWRASLADFVSSMIAFWVSLFVSTSVGIASAVGFNIVYVLLRQVFARVATIPDPPRSELAAALDESRDYPSSVPADTRVFRLTDSLFFPNSYRAKTAIMDTIKTRHAPALGSAENPEAGKRNWSVSREKHVAKLRRREGIAETAVLPPIRVIVIDFQRANHVDTTACVHLETMLSEIRAYGGSGVSIRFSGMSEYVRRRFERAGWTLVGGGSDDAETCAGRQQEGLVVRTYRNALSAVNGSRQEQAPTQAESEGDEKGGAAVARHVEEVDP